jgi:hypothetical protein
MPMKYLGFIFSHLKCGCPLYARLASYMGRGMAGEVGILAYGSLVGNPGSEIEAAIVKRINCRTPFKVEFARTSNTRKGAPTLVPYDNGAEVAAQVLIVDLPLSEAIHRLYRREIDEVGSAILYDSSKKVTPNRVVVETLRDFERVDTVLYTSIGANIEGLSPSTLATLAIKSARALNNGRDGISYLINAKNAGVRTPLSDQYEAEIIRMAGATSLEDALARLRAEASA